MARPSVKQLEKQAELIGTVYAQAYLGQLSAEDRDDVVRNEGIRSQLREFYSAAVADVGEKKAMKAVISSARGQADAAIYTARRMGLAPGPYGDYRPVLQAAEQAIQQMLFD